MKLCVVVLCGLLLGACTQTTAYSSKDGRYYVATSMGGEWSQVKGNPRARELFDELERWSGGGDGGTQ